MALVIRISSWNQAPVIRAICFQECPEWPRHVVLGCQLALPLLSDITINGHILILKVSNFDQRDGKCGLPNSLQCSSILTWSVSFSFNCDTPQALSIYKRGSHMTLYCFFLVLFYIGALNQKVGRREVPQQRGTLIKGLVYNNCFTGLYYCSCIL